MADSRGKSVTPETLTAFSTAEKMNRLNGILGRLLDDGLMIAFSGGVDSAFLLYAARQLQQNTERRLLAVTALSPSLASAERDDAIAFAGSLGVEHLLEKTDEFESPDYLRNDSNRCYFCKSALFEMMAKVGSENRLRNIAYGYNASDQSDFRPGHKAALENGVHSPLEEAGMTKEEIRNMLRAAGLSIADKPASPCLSSRVMTNVAITPARLSCIEQMEAILRSHGVAVSRVRLHNHDGVSYFRIEVMPDDMPLVVAAREELLRKTIELGYGWVSLDLAGYRTGGGNTAPRSITSR